MAVTTENPSDMVSGVRKLNEKLRNELGYDDCSLRVDNFHVLCLPQIINLTFQDFMGIIHDEVSEMLLVQHTIRSSVKQRDI